MKKVIIAGIGAVMLLGGGAYGMKSFAAEDNQPQTKVEAKTTSEEKPLLGKKFEVLNQFKDQVHQVNQLHSERLDLKKQLVDKKDQLIDLYLAAKNSKNKEDLKKAKEVKQELKDLNADLKPLRTEQKDEKKALKEMKSKNGEGSEQFNKLISTNQQINEKLQAKIGEVNKIIEILK